MLLEALRTAGRNLRDNLIELTPQRWAEHRMEQDAKNAYAVVVLGMTELTYSLTAAMGGDMAPETRESIDKEATQALIILLANRKGRDPLVNPLIRSTAHRLYAALPSDMVDRSLDIWS